MPLKKEPIKAPVSKTRSPGGKAAATKKTPAKNPTAKKPTKTKKSDELFGLDAEREDLTDTVSNTMSIVRRPGRPKGSLDKGNASIREMIVTALTDLGGSKYFVHVAKSRPDAFLALIGRLLPTQVVGAGGAPLVPPSITFVCDE